MTQAKHYWLVAIQATISEDDSLQQIKGNPVIVTTDPYFSNLDKQKVLNMFSKSIILDFGIKPENLLEVFILSVSLLGCMTEEQFLGEDIDVKNN